ncbi:bifunctional 3-(3-hydroxy-phenyl)propionate/3-hydroxycinnamic acid hydroxylase [Streptomyces sp. V4-01]|uniref:Bifunctional 3-(3-hydroxy-phenyl)propionate/3-hydroxycinnamic acid hydroxylase n=1 Tax=Actinacidiphila polyblastidii TaxID=3110430 RepID=A0ABU7PGA0_9ACTN|nr:bifunctional 3-(3-hydroxy-phenyl)propionate/3-hydroxycinnamic acid hydroxylase [Streptomyces sp. V4-01]
MIPDPTAPAGLTAPAAPAAPAETCDVAIVGFGPVGQMLALLLGRAGHRVVALERWPQPYDLPRAVHFDDEVGRIFQNAGIAAEVASVTDPVPDHYEWRTAAGEPLVRIDWSGTGPSGWPVANFFSQPDLEAVLTRAACAQPTVTVHRGHDVVALHERADRVRLTARTTSGEQRVLDARYVVGADGANSFVRSRMNVAVTDLGFFYDWLIVDTLPHDFDQVPWSPMNWQLCDPARPTTVVSGGPRRRRWEFMRLPGENVEQLNTVESAWELLAPWGRTPGNTTIERHAVYTFQARWADRWNQDRLLLAGDAAHQMPPFAGQGMCSGLRDAANLSWKMDLVLRGLAGACLLDTYTSERSVHLQHAVGMSMALGQVICVLDPAQAAERDARMIAADADPARALPPAPPPVLGDGVLQHGPDGSRAPDVGHLTPQFPVAHAGRTALLDDLTGPGFTLLTDGAGPLDALDETDRAFLDSIGTTVVPLSSEPSASGGYLDTEGAYLGHLVAHGHTAALIRPDSYLYGATALPHELPGLVAQLRTQLAADSTADRTPGTPPAPTAARPLATTPDR